MPSDWETLSYKVSKNAGEVSAIWSALKPIVWGRVDDNVRQLVYNQVDKLKLLEDALTTTGKQIDKFADDDDKELQGLKDVYEKERQDLTRGYENKLKRQNSEIKKLENEVQELKRKLDSEYPKPPPQSSPIPPDNNKKPSPPNDSKSVDSSDEATAKTLIAEGRRAFDIRNFEVAEKNFNQARKRIDQLSPESRKKFNEHEIDYHLAACAVFDPGLQLTEKAMKLTMFLNAPRSSHSLTWSHLAHMNHLLAQLYVQLGDLKSAEASCKTTSYYTSTMLAQDPLDQHQYEQAGLLIRINVLNKEDDVVNNAIAKGIPRPWRAWFSQRYSFLQPKGSPKQPSNPLRPEPPEGIVPAPTWLVPRLSFKSQKPIPPPAPAPPVPELPHQPTRVISKLERIRWLQRLELRDSHDSFQEAIIESDVESIKSLVRGLPDWASAPETALHIAALFGEVTIASYLIKAGCSANRACRIARLRKENGQLHSYGITPMHVAIGAQHHSMIRLLKENDGSFKFPKNHGLKNSPTAAPRFLLSEGWLELIGCENPKEVAQTVDVLVSLGWDINAPLNEKGRTLRDYAAELRYNVRGFQQAVTKDLVRRGAK